MSQPASLRDVSAGNFRFLPGIPPFSSGVVAMSGFQVVHATLRAPIPWRDGFGLIDRHLRAESRPRAALCAIELRIAAPFSFEGFENPIARTNVAPVVGAPSAPSLYAFSYTVPGATTRPTFVVAGSGETRERGAGAAGIVRHGETSPEAMREKAAHVMSTEAARLRALGADWPDVTIIDVYTAEPIETFLPATILRQTGAAAIHGIRWFLSRPPVAGLEFEMDLRGVVREITLEV